MITQILKRAFSIFLGKLQHACNNSISLTLKLFFVLYSFIFNFSLHDSFAYIFNFSCVPSIFLSSFSLPFQSFHLTVILFSFRVLAVRIHRAKIMQLVSLVSHQRDIDAYVLLDSKVKTVKKVRFRKILQKFQYDFYVNMHDCHHGS